LLLASLAITLSGCATTRTNLPWDKQLVGTWYFNHKTMSGTFTYNADGTTLMRLDEPPMKFKGRWVIIDRDKRIIENQMEIGAGKANQILVTIDRDTMTQQAIGGDIVYTYTR